MDSVSSLRRFASKLDEIRVDGEDIVFGNGPSSLRFSGKEKIKITGASGTGGGADESNYTLFEIYHFLIHKDEKVAEYIRHANAAHVGWVRTKDRDPVLSFVGLGLEKTAAKTTNENSDRTSATSKTTTVTSATDSIKPAQQQQAQKTTSSKEQPASNKPSAARDAASSKTANENKPSSTAIGSAQNIAIPASSSSSLKDGAVATAPAVSKPSAVPAGKRARTGGPDMRQAGELVRYDRNSMLESPASLLKINSMLTQQEANKSRKASSSASSSSANALGNLHKSGSSSRQMVAQRRGGPIVVVPPNSSAVITLYNVKRFLGDFTYVPMEEAMKEYPNGDKPKEVRVLRVHPQAGNVEYRVVDSVADFSDEEMNRIVAIFVSGAAWQLKDWRRPRSEDGGRTFRFESPTEIFAAVKGIHLYFDDTKLPDLVRSWNVSHFPLKKQSRNKDAVQANSIWSEIDRNMQNTHEILLNSLIEEHRAKREALRRALLKAKMAAEEEEEEDEAEAEGGGMVMTHS